MPETTSAQEVRGESQLHGEKHPRREKLEDKFVRRQG